MPDRSMRDLVVQVFKALADPTRLDMLRLIDSLGEYPCTSLEHALPVGKSTISYHVKILSNAGLVSVRRQGRNFFYTLHRDVLDFYAPGLLQRLASDPMPTAGDLTDS
ncbi:metalloregulator ArsR/SmtB family transcription factor [Nocardioides sp. NPDC047086]|uniref:ArsR/SmtB family transcription factor n=1 Tax=Nocardioides sp. NPDC047086 TaxID=3154810 RepID=UPI0033DAD69D